MPESNSKSAVATPETSTAAATRTAPVKPKLLPPYRVILHNDDKNVIEDVVARVIVLTGLSKDDAIHRTLEAHQTGCALLLVTHKERAELYVEQFQSSGLTVTIEPDE